MNMHPAPNTIGENIIATTKIPNNYGAIQSFFQYCDSNIGLFFIAFCKVITPNPLCILFGISSFDGSLSKDVALLTIAIAIVVLKAIAKRLPLLFANAFKTAKERQLSQ